MPVVAIVCASELRSAVLALAALPRRLQNTALYGVLSPSCEPRY